MSVVDHSNSLSRWISIATVIPAHNALANAAYTSPLYFHTASVMTVTRKFTTMAAVRRSSSRLSCIGHLWSSIADNGRASA